MTNYIRIILLALVAILFSVAATAQTSLVGSDGKHYKVDSTPSGVVLLKEGQERTIKKEKCSNKNTSFYTLKETCVTAKVVIVSGGALVEKGGEETIKEEYRPEILMILIGVVCMLVTTMLLFFNFNALEFFSITGLSIAIISAMSTAVALLIGFVSNLTVFVTVFTLFVAVAAVASASVALFATKHGNSKVFFGWLGSTKLGWLSCCFCFFDAVTGSG